MIVNLLFILFQRQIKESCRVARDKAERAYIKYMTQRLMYMYSQNDLQHDHNSAHKLATTIYDTCPIFGGKNIYCKSTLEKVKLSLRKIRIFITKITLNIKKSNLIYI